MIMLFASLVNGSRYFSVFSLLSWSRKYYHNAEMKISLLFENGCHFCSKDSKIMYREEKLLFIVSFFLGRKNKGTF